MRVLLIPEVYRRDDLSTNGTVADAVSWVRSWLEFDSSIHVYWLLPPREDADFVPSDVLADSERVTLLEAEPFGSNLEPTAMVTEGGYSEAELCAVEQEIFDRGAYLDIVVDGRRVDRRTLVKWLLAHVDQWAARVRPFDVIVNVHDLQIPRKYRYCSYRDRYQHRMELCDAALSDGTWITAPVDARAFRDRASELLHPEVFEEALERSVEIGSPLDFGRFEESYADRPRRFHVAGSLWEKKHAADVLAIAETLHDRFGVRTILTSMEDIPDEYTSREWIDAHPNADVETYERALRRGDLAVCASEYETLARTWFEQAASGQVLLLRNEPWVYDCVPEAHPLVAPIGDLGELAVRAVERWDEAVAANRDLVAHLERVRAPERVGERTYDDMRRRVDAKRSRYGLAGADEGSKNELEFDQGKIVTLVGSVLDDVEETRIALDAIIERTTAAENESAAGLETIATIDVVYALRALGWRDVGDSGTPTFERPADGR